MAETQCLPIIEEEEIEIDEEFYENIEAPKFVDLTAPDSRRPDDDRHWFCFRVGCDQKHEQELDSETVYKNFVLRVMAARSPNVRLRKALNRRQASENLKCPLTAPAKSRVSRMDYISSLSHKMTDNNVKKKPVSKVAATPNAKVKQPPSVARALTTPRNHQKKVSNVEQFRSVQSKKTLTVGVPKSRVVAKALVFHSPKKVVKIKSSIELKTPMRALCSAMKKLELNGVKKNGEGSKDSLPVAASKRQLKGREVKSRVFDSLYSNNRKEPDTNPVTSSKKKKVKNGMQKRQVTARHENDSSDMEMDEKPRCASLERCHESGTSGSGSELSLGDEKSQELTREESSVPVLKEASRGDITSGSSSNNEENKRTERSQNEESGNSVSDKGKVSEVKKRKAEENSLASDEKENERQFTENDDKENSSAPHENIVTSTNNDNPKKAILGSNHEDSRKTHKKSSSTSTTSQVVKYRKLKPTNPKPFKLRTDERGILKEATLDRKIPSPLKETKGDHKAMRKHQNANRKSETCSTKQDTDNYSSCDEKINHTTRENQSKSETCSTKQDTDNYSSCDEKINHTTRENQSGSTQSDNFNCKVQRKLSATTPPRNPRGPKIATPRSALARKKEKVVIPTKLSVIVEKPSNIVKPKEAAKARKNDAGCSPPTSKTSGSTHNNRSSSQGRRALTVPKEPKFQTLHVPKGCTTRKLN
ncbi:hypothetical protein Fmac_009955 [Flemingia macrophylla]|uniref:Uncharacterized protein n=1 Tax=Flemingia macrophylla TaxID=520843 RepID=A0ABD1N1P1_9FABA